MKRRSFLQAGATALAAPALAAGRPARAQADGYPSRAVHVIVPFVPGGTTDALGRFVAQALAETWRQPVVVDNRAGAGGIIGTEAIAKAAPDGHTIGLIVSAHTIHPWMEPKPAYDAVADFSFITLATRVPKVLLAHPGVPADGIGQLIELSKNRPAQYASISSSGVGSAAHLTVELLNRAARTRFVHIPYKGSAAAFVDLLSGQVPLTITDINNALPLIRAQKAKAIALLGDRRSLLLPDVAALNETFAGHSVHELYGFVGPKGLPDGIVQKLGRDIGAVLSSDAARERFTTNLGIDFAPGPPEAFRALVTSEIDQWGRLIREADVKFN